ncbi:5'/3'-nucleotidase SurE [Halarsenatibacter silvermanii]|uniref:5'-nucleotidase SurE n=1 Tax=Halarsenatibacter silvermanii TaxID=321763 RepID=A0A1G9LLS8_9FIRM|nr:5'/3'-nucleotidase SurE [Halarsenatibacter silvermanii]SDL62891.1 5'-nucleotidase /3'-nucleotidase /exopolyphosphatase [Halarsenatibacter silvermanii]
MRILVTNDDGVHAEGIKAMAGALEEEGHEIIVIAPGREMSASSHSITINSPLRKREVKNYDLDCRVYKVNGTPADCVKLGLHTLEEFKPELVISGINNGKNLGYDVFYSGTVAAAVEAHLQGYNSLAVSLSVKDKRNFKEAALIVEELISTHRLFYDREDQPLNINIPDLARKNVKGIKVTNLTPQIYDRAVEKRIDPEGRDYFWFVGGDEEIDFPDSDIQAVNEGYISLTPLKLKTTDKNRKKKLNHLEKFETNGDNQR